MPYKNFSVDQFIETNGLNARYSGSSQDITASDQPRVSVVQECIMHTMEQTLSGCENPFPSSAGRGASQVYSNPPFILE